MSPAPYSRFDFLAKLLRAEVRSEVEAYVKGDLDHPLLIEFDPTTACNYKCPECISAGLLNKERISTERIESLIEEFARSGVRGIIFIGGGEPLAHRCMPRPIRQAYEAGLAVGIVTNGSLVHRHLDTISECAHWTRVSMDAGTAETYLAFRPNTIPDSFRKTIKNMELLARTKRGALGYSFLVMQRPVAEADAGRLAGRDGPLVMRDANSRPYLTNAHEILSAARIAKETGCDYFEYKPMVDATHYLLPFGPELRQVIAEQAGPVAALADESFEVIAPYSIEYLHSTDDPVQPKTYTTCAAMELRTLVTPSGIYPCPYHRGRSDKVLGSVDGGPFDEWWRSGDRKAAMTKIDPSVDCGFYCIRHQTNLVMNALQELDTSGISLLDHLSRTEGIDDPFF